VVESLVLNSNISSRTSLKMAAHYTPLSHEDSDDEISPQEHLLSVSTMSSRQSEGPTTWSATLNPTFALRLVSVFMEIIAFVLLVVDGDVPFIATDIFLAFIILLDFFTIIHHSISDIFKITVELRNGSWSHDIRGSEKSNVAARLDMVLTGCLTICLMVGNGIKAEGWPGAWIGGTVLGYLIM
jgi:hypothetical protein